MVPRHHPDLFEQLGGAEQGQRLSCQRFDNLQGRMVAQCFPEPSNVRGLVGMEAGQGCEGCLLRISWGPAHASSGISLSASQNLMPQEPPGLTSLPPKSMQPFCQTASAASMIQPGEEDSMKWDKCCMSVLLSAFPGTGRPSWSLSISTCHLQHQLLVTGHATRLQITGRKRRR